MRIVAVLRRRCGRITRYIAPSTARTLPATRALAPAAFQRARQMSWKPQCKSVQGAPSDAMQKGSVRRKAILATINLAAARCHQISVSVKGYQRQAAHHAPNA